MKQAWLAVWALLCLVPLLPLELLAQASTGDSYTYIIPFVTAENNSRSNLGLNGYIRDSIVKGANPSANVHVELDDPQGNVAGSGNYVVQPNQLVQINNVISALGGTIGTGYLIISSDEPITAWASVIFNSTNDPSVEMAIDVQGRKPTAYVDGIARGEYGTRLLIQSSVKTGTFSSSLVVVNINASAGPFTIETYDNNGVLQGSKVVNIGAGGMYVDNDIRNSVPGTFGEIVITPGEGTTLRLVANSIVKSVNETGAFFPAFTLPSADTISLAGIWDGTATGTLINGQVRLEIHQEKEMYYGRLIVVSGSFPTTTKAIPVYGLASLNEPGALQNTFLIDTDPAGTVFSIRLIAALHLGTKVLDGSMTYYDSKSRSDTASFSMTRTSSLN
ncbi:MAG: hypothetical protein U0V70_10175 [Terriglobia bacterium]